MALNQRLLLIRGTIKCWATKQQAESLPSELHWGCREKQLEHLFSLSLCGYGERRWSEARRCEANIPHTSSKPAASNPYGKGQGNQWPRGENTWCSVWKNEAGFAAVGVDGGQGAEHFWYQVPNEAEWHTPGAPVLSHSSGFPCAPTQPALSPRIDAGNVGERFSESRNDPAPSPASLRAVPCLDSACGKVTAGDVPWHLQETWTECGGGGGVRARALMSSAGGKASRKDYADVLEVRSSYSPWEHHLRTGAVAAALGLQFLEEVHFLMEVPSHLHRGPQALPCINSITKFLHTDTCSPGIKLF